MHRNTGQRMAERWLLRRLLRRRVESWMDLLRFLRETGTLTILIVVAILLLGPLSEGLLALHKRITENPEWSAMMAESMWLVYIAPFLLALRTRFTPSPVAPDRFAVIHSGRYDSVWGAFVARWVARSAGVMLLAGALLATVLLVGAHLLSLRLPFSAGLFLPSFALLFAAIPGWSVLLHVWVRRWVIAPLLRWAVIIGVGALLSQAHWMNAIASRPGLSVLVVVLALGSAVLPILLLRQRGYPDGEALLREMKLRRAIRLAKDATERRAYSRELASGRSRSRWGQRLYARGWGAYAVRSLMAWWNESPLQWILAFVALIALPLVVWRLQKNELLAAMLGSWAEAWQGGSTVAWIPLVAGLSVIGLMVARLPSAGWRQDLRNPQLRIWMRSPLRYTAENGALPLLLTLLWVVCVAAIIVPHVPGSGLRGLILLWLIAQTPLWCTLVVYEPWVDTLQSAESASVVPSATGAQQGYLFSVAMSLLPGAASIVLSTGLSLSVSLAVGSVAAVLVLIWVWRLVQPAWAE